MDSDPDSAAEAACDELGFQLDAGSSAYAERFAPKAKRRLNRFEARRRRLQTPGDWASLPRGQLKALLRKGVPPQHRAEVWWSVLGCHALRERSPCAYNAYLGDSPGAQVCEEIERDIPRTFPAHRKFQTDEGRCQLRNVLRAFAMHFPAISYCQGLNFLAALLLVVFLDEERAFWAMASAIDSIGAEGYYTEGMLLLRADMRVLTGLLGQMCPRTAKLFGDEKVELTSICSEWYITWFAKCMPIPTLLRVWDTLFFEGFKVLFRVALGVFKRSEAEILKGGSFDFVMENSKLFSRQQVDHNELLKASFRGMRRPLRRRDLLQARSSALEELRIEDDEHIRRAEANAAALRAAAARKATSEGPPPAPGPGPLAPPGAPPDEPDCDAVGPAALPAEDGRRRTGFSAALGSQGFSPSPLPIPAMLEDDVPAPPPSPPTRKVLAFEVHEEVASL